MSSPQRLALNNGLLEQLQAQFPKDTQPDPSSPISKGIAALERRASNRSAASQTSKPSSPIERSRMASPPLPLRMHLTLNTISGSRSTTSSPGPLTGSRETPPPLTIKRKTRPSSELFLPTPASARSFGFRFSTVIHEEGTTSISTSPKIETASTTPTAASPVPLFASPPTSPISAYTAQAISQLDVDASIQNALNNLSVPGADRFIFPPLRSSTAPPGGLRRQASFLSIKSSRSLPLRTFSIRSSRFSRAGGGSSRGAGIKSQLTPKKRGSQFSGIDKDVAADKRASSIMARRKSDLESIVASPVEEQALKPALRKTTSSVMPWRRKARGETMSMLLDSGFFPVSEYIYNPNETSPSTKSTSKRNQLALNILVKDLPTERPSSIVSTPTNFYQQGFSGLRRSTRNNQRRSLGVRRRILNAASVSSSQVSPTMITHRSVTAPPLSPMSPMTPLTPTKALAALTGGSLLTPPSPGSDDSYKHGQASPGILEVIPEDGGVVAAIMPTHSPLSKTPRHSEPEAPALPKAIASEIHLNSGTVLMVQTPETTAWRRSVYTQGPIKLPTPAVVPRKGSIATLDPFQDSLITEPTPRRKSEDMAANDICAWYDQWGFENVSFAFDEFKLEDVHTAADWALAPLPEEPESPIDRAFRFTTPAPPLVKEMAAAMLEDRCLRPESQAIKPKPPSMIMPTVPLPELPKTPSTGGSEKGHSRNSSGETSYKSAKSDPIIRSDSRGSGMSGISSVEENSWLDSDKGKRRESSEGPLKAKPRMSRMRRFVQTASAIL
jgi:hypothetical protein